MTSGPMSEIGTTRDVADLLPVATATLRSWRRRGIGPRSFKIGRVVCYDLAEVREWIAQQAEATSRGGAA